MSDWKVQNVSIDEERGTAMVFLYPSTGGQPQIHIQGVPVPDASNLTGSEARSKAVATVKEMLLEAASKL